MSTIRNLSSAGCGCSGSVPVRPDNLVIASQGSMIVQAPCAEGCSPPSTSAISAIQQAPAATNGILTNPCVQQTFVVSAINKPGQFFATAASQWAVPGAFAYFDGFGHLQITGVSGNVVSYINITVEPGTQILAGKGFGVAMPPPNVATDDEGEVVTIDTASTLDAIYGEEGNQQRRILPVDGQILFGCGGKWNRRAAGLMFYPTARTLLTSFTGNIGAKSGTLNFSGLPSSTVQQCALGLFASVDVDAVFVKTTSADGPKGTVSINGADTLYVVATNGTHGENARNVMVNIGKGNTSVPCALGQFASLSYGTGTVTVNFYLNGYWY